MSSLATLPPETIVHICGYLPQHAFVMLGRTCKRLNKCVYTTGAIPRGRTSPPSDSTFCRESLHLPIEDLMSTPYRELIDKMRATPNNRELYNQAFWWAKGMDIAHGDALNIGSVGDSSDDSPERMWMEAPPTTNNAQSLEGYLKKNPWIRRVQLPSILIINQSDRIAFIAVLVRAAVDGGVVIGVRDCVDQKPPIGACADLLIGVILYSKWNVKHINLDIMAIGDKQDTLQELTRAKAYLQAGLPFWPTMDDMSIAFPRMYIALADLMYFSALTCSEGASDRLNNAIFAFYNVHDYNPEMCVITLTTGISSTANLPVVTAPDYTIFEDFGVFGIMTRSRQIWGRSLVDAPLLWAGRFVIRYCLHQCTERLCPLFIHLTYVRLPTNTEEKLEFLGCSLSHLHFCKNDH